MPIEKHVLVVDDERDLVELVSMNIQRAGYRTSTASNGREALAVIQKDKPDLIILDIMMPEMNGIDVASRLRANPETARTPIIMLTAKGEEVDEVVGLSIGADDYLSKPFSMKVLLARVQALLRRSGGGEQLEPAILELGPVRIDMATHEARVHGEEMKLTLTEFRVLASLIEADGRVLSRQALIKKAIGPGITVTERTIDVHVTAIRRKLGAAAFLLQTVRGVGYRATLQPQSDTVGLSA
ncbi:MAG: response regulator transcription factor [Phycisphaeraceae bacterium]|nr:response regulator transcription factor [Phycisphaeraceae bacterium]